MNRFPPGATIGFLGGGQLARMMALEARRMGYRIAVLDPDEDGSAAQVADIFVKGEFTDLAAAQKLADCSDVVTLDTEHVPAEILEQLERTRPVRPGADVLRIVQDRREQRRFLDGLGVPQTAHAEVSDLESFRLAAEVVGYPCVLKTRRSGYDGRGQAKVRSVEDLERAWKEIGGQPAVLEAFVDFEMEVSVLLARDLDGKMCFYSLAENLHRNHILHTTHAPARVDQKLVSQAEEIGAQIATGLNHVGMMAVELFVTRDGALLVNEIAPRTHNSGHFTFGACATSQFEQHVRAICGLPLGDVELLRPAIMLNLLGDLWQDGEPDWSRLLAIRSTHLHLYGKQSARVGRKMGHLVVLGGDDGDADAALAAAETELAKWLRAG